MLLFSALVAGSFSLGAQVANDIDPMAVTTFRFGAGAILIGALAMLQGRSAGATFAAPWRYFVLGALFAGYFVLMFEGLKTAPPVSTSAVYTLTPVLAALFGWLVLRQLTTLWMATAMAIGAIGALWVIFRADLSAFLNFEFGHGERVFFVGCVMHALYIPLVRRLNRGESALQFTSGMLIAGFLMLLAYGWSEVVQTQWTDLSPLIWLVLGYLTFFSTAASFVLLQFASLKLPAANVMAYTYLTPAWVILWEIGLGNTAPSAFVMVGVLLAIIALLILLRSEQKRHSAAP